uniref:Alpha/beta hydrolase fold-3 domain-containing protein n=1 Tax=Solanum lycopersicum TaxID=4081 RepID=A0A3Q7I777_SOLLC
MITISSHVSARLYLPKNTNVFCNVKIPVLVFYDGGGLVIGSAFFNDIHYFLNHLVFKSNVICVSLEYRLAPENDLSILYEDVGLASNASYKESWLTSYADFNRVFIGGEIFSLLQK